MSFAIARGRAICWGSTALRPGPEPLERLDAAEFSVAIYPPSDVHVL
jgi:hypothetical protein